MWALLCDFGSTFTKTRAVDLGTGEVIAAAQAPTTARSDLSEGLGRAISALDVEASGEPAVRLACSSAAGGLGMVAIGLTPTLTGEAARQAALGAGAKLLRSYSHRLTRADVAELEQLAADIVLLAGGTDGGESTIILGNARMLAASALSAVIVYAGNRQCADDAAEVLRAHGKHVEVVENVLPELGVLNIEPTREIIRQMFMRHIVHAKGLDGVQARFADVVMPTPMAVLEGAKLLAEGMARRVGWGDLIVVDVGGATTDVHSVAEGTPSQPGVVWKGLPQSRVKRTVEGDLGIRINASTIAERLRGDRKWRHHLEGLEESWIDEQAASLARTVERLPASAAERSFDAGLAAAAVDIAVSRHAGRIERYWGPDGAVRVQRGKDLSSVRSIVGTGGIFAHSEDAAGVLRAALYRSDEPDVLRPRDPRLFLDSEYAMASAGLLARAYPESALMLLERTLKETA